MSDYSLYIGICAGACTGISMLPQLIKIIRDRQANDISYFMLFILLAGVGGWVWYGVLKKDYPIIITNCFSFIVNALVLVFSLRYKNK